MKTKTYKVYKFNELPEEAKKKAVENYSDINVDYDDWYHDDGLLDVEQTKWVKLGLKDCLFKWNKLYFDLDRGQYIQFEGLEVTDKEVFRKVLGIPKSLWENTHFYFPKTHRETSTTIEFEHQENGEFTEKQNEVLNKAIERFDNLVHKAWVNLRDDYEYLTSEKAIIETFEANDYDFTEEGKID